jgi:glycosyltransferase involved in cell wall biosynthesis
MPEADVHGERPEISVVVASHERPLRLRWLLNALEEQSLPRERFEVVVAHDSASPETEDLLQDHPLARAGVLRHLRFDPSDANSAARLRNAAWRAARAPLIAITDDDCRPPRDWVEKALAAGRANPGAIVQGMTVHDPDEAVNERGPWWHSQTIIPPGPWAQTCNIVYPRELLERLGGFLEDPPLAAGEDTELAERGRQAGAPYVGAREVLTYHAVVPLSLRGKLRGLGRWQDLAWLVKRHPRLREDYPLWVFWKPTHVWLPVAAAGAVLGARRNALYTALAIPWVVHTMPGYGEGHPRGRIRALTEMPGRLAIDLTEFATMVRGSVKYRTLFL